MIKPSKNNKKIVRITNNILNVLIVLLSLFLIVTIFSYAQMKLTKAKYSNLFGYSLFEVKTGSMKPAIKEGDFIVVKITKDVKNGDIVSFVQDEDVITHRVIETYKNTYVTRGDANNSKDKPISSEQIIGKVSLTIPFFGLIKHTVFNPFVLISLIITIVLFNLLFKEEKEKPIKEKEEKIDKTIKMNRDDLFDTGLLDKKVKIVEDTSFEIDSKEKLDDKDDKSIDKTLTNTVLINKISDDYESTIQIDDIGINEDVEDELGKTTLFRVISVDSEELENTLVNITEEEIKKPVEEIIVEKEEEIEDEEPPIESLKTKAQIKRSVDNDLELLLALKEEEVFDLFNILIKDETLAVKLSKVYSEGMYFNTYKSNPLNYSGKSHHIRMDKILKSYTKDLKKEVKSKQDLAPIYLKYYNLITTLDNAYLTIKSDDRKIAFFKKEINSYLDEENEEIVEKIYKTKQKYNKLREDYYNKVTAPTFELEMNDLTSRRNKYLVRLLHNITFSNVFSDYIINKTYSEGIISEDKLEITITLLIKKLAKEALVFDYKNEYYIKLPATLMVKPKKLQRILNLASLDFAKKRIIFTLPYTDFVSSFKVIKEYKQEGFMFALYFEKNDELELKDRKQIYLADYIFVTNKVKKQLTKTLKEDFKGSVIYEDISNKIEEVRGE